MDKQFDDTNTGVLFEPRGEQITKQGRVNIDGQNLNMVVVKKSIPAKDGSGTIEILEPYVSAGRIFKSDKQKFRDVEKAPDFQGEVETSIGNKYGFYRSRTDKNGNKLISISLVELKQNNGGISPTDSPQPGLISVPSSAGLDDEIPF